MNGSARIGVVEDNDDLRLSLIEVLTAIGHAVIGYSCAEDVDDSPEMLDLMLVDLNLPGEDGLALVERLKRAQPGLRVIMMTSRTALRDRVRGYDAGADLYLPKPVDEAELLAAVRALTRQLRADSQRTIGDDAGVFKLDMKALRLSGPLGTTEISAVEAALLASLARAPGQRLEHWQIMAVIGLDLDAQTGRANLAVRMTRLRNKLGEAGFPSDALRSVRGTGYQLCVRLEVA
jgi:DNA-binding response OmpR family regulator